MELEPDQNTRQIPAGELAAERKVMQRVAEMFKSAFVPTGAAGYYGVTYDILPHAVTNKSRYGNTCIFTLSNHKIECRSGKPVALDVSLRDVSVQVNTGLLSYYQRLLSDATDAVAFVKQAQVPRVTESRSVFTTLEDRANRIYVTGNGRAISRASKLREIVHANPPEFRSMVK